MPETVVVAASPAEVAKVEPPKVDPPKVDPPKEERLYAGKYKTVEDMEKGYGELSKKLGTKAPAAEPSPMQIGTVDMAAGEDLPIPEIIEKAGLKLADLTKSFAETGELTDDQYKAIHKARPGLSRADVKMIAKGMAAEASLVKVTQDQIFQEAATIVGGPDKLKTLLNSGAQFIPADELEDTQARLCDPKKFKSAIRDMLAWHTAKVGPGGTIISGSGGGGKGGAKDIKEFNELVRKAQGGDSEAIARIRATPDNMFSLGR